MVSGSTAFIWVGWLGSRWRIGQQKYGGSQVLGPVQDEMGFKRLNGFVHWLDMGAGRMQRR